MTTRARPPRRTGLRAGLSAGGWAPALTPSTAMRIALLGGIALTLLGLLLIRLWFLQVISGEQYAEAAEGNRLRTVVLDAPRGKVLDRNGELLVGVRTGTNLVVDPRELAGARREQVLNRVAAKLDGVTGAELVARVEAGEERPFESVVIAQNVPPALSYYLAQRERQFPGVRLRDTYLRTYPQDKLAAHVLGGTGKITAEELDDFRSRGYEGNETVGQGGVEQEYEGFLRGAAGSYTREVDAAGEPTGREVVSSRAPRPGRDVQLTIDAPTQRALQEALAEQVSLNGLSTGGAGVALDPNTGEVLAMASYPDFDPSLFVSGSQKRIESVIANPDKVLLNRAIGGNYPAGSTFKAISSAAGLEGGFISADEEIESPSEIELYKTVFPNFRNRSHGYVTLPVALEVSSDTYFYQLGDEFYRAQGSPLQEEARTFGLGERTGLDLPGEVDGLIPDPDWKRQNFAGAPFTDLDRSWKPGDTINLSVGQGYLNVTPLQMAVAYGAIANGGTVHTPSVGRRVLDPNGRQLQELSSGKPTGTIDVSPDNLASIREGLYRAANGTGGTSTSVFGLLPADRKVAGKTGTAEQVEGKEDHSWFVGYAPYDDPKIVVAVVIEAAGTGSSAAAPTVCRTIAAFSGTSFDPAICGEGADPDLTTIARPRSARSGLGDRVRGAILGLDWVLLLAVVAITGFSLFVIGRSTEGDVPGDPRFYLDRQILFVALGVVAMAVAMRINLDHVSRWAWALWAGLLISLAVVYAAGEATRGSNRWIDIGAFSLQPSEFGKVLLMVVLAGIALQRIDSVGTVRFTALLTGVAAVPAAVVFLQPDLGTSLVYAVVVAAILFLVGVPWTHFAVFGTALAVLILSVLWLLPATGFKVLEDYQVERLTAFVGAERDTSDAGYQLDQSKTAIGSGGTLGKGPDGATQANNDFLPEHHTDFIFAVTSEMFGFAGGGLLILLYGLILWRGLRTMARASSQVDMLVAGAILAMLGFQVFVNIGMTVGIMPITGIPLPLMSYGGSQTITTLIAVGLLLGIHRRRSPIPG